MRKSKSGFTIVELLIVIVVIAILAAITIVAYNGVQERARYSSMKSDIITLNKAILMYYADNGTYPTNSLGSNYVTSANSGATMNIPGLVPTYISKIPTIPNDGKSGYYAYIASANASEYKILRLVPSGPLPGVELSDSNIDYRTDANGNKRGWGIWSPGGSSL